MRGQGRVQVEYRRQGMKPIQSRRREARKYGRNIVWHREGRAGGGGGGGIVYGIAEVSVVGTVSMNFEFIEGGETGYKVVKFGGVKIADEEIIYYEGKSHGVGVMAEEHGGGGFGVAVLGKEGDTAELG